MGASPEGCNEWLVFSESLDRREDLAPVDTCTHGIYTRYTQIIAYNSAYTFIRVDRTRSWHESSCHSYFSITYAFPRKTKPKGRTKSHEATPVHATNSHPGAPKSTSSPRDGELPVTN